MDQWTTWRTNHHPARRGGIQKSSSLWFFSMANCVLFSFPTWMSRWNLGWMVRIISPTCTYKCWSIWGYNNPLIRSPLIHPLPSRDILSAGFETSPAPCGSFRSNSRWRWAFEKTNVRNHGSPSKRHLCRNKYFWTFGKTREPFTSKKKRGPGYFPLKYWLFTIGILIMVWL